MRGRTSTRRSWSTPGRHASGRKRPVLSSGVRTDLRNGLPDKATVARLMIGPSGNLRAPTLRVGRKVLVGFDEDSYRKVLG